MDIVDREVELAEEQASRGFSGQSREHHQPLERATRTSTISTSGSSATTSSISTRPDLHSTMSMGRTTTANTLERRRTNAIEVHRSETQRLQQSYTVGAGITKTRTSQKPLPNFGGGKPYPPDLPAQDEYVVEYDGKDDPLHPQNWPMSRKIHISVILAYTCLCSTFTSSVFSASTQAVARHFHVGIEVSTLSTSFYVLGYAFGPILWGPLSELQGRRLPIIIGMFGFSIFSLAVAVSKDIQTLLISRFFTGIFGSCPLAVVAAVYTDIFDNKQRGPAVTIFATTVFMGPMLGPFIGGFIVTSYLGWRWTAYLSSIMGWLSFGLIVLFLRESYPPVVLVAKAAELRRRTKNWGIHAKQEEVEVDINELITKNFSRPIRLLFTEPVILLITIYMSFIYGLLYLFLTAYPLVFQGVHRMSPGVGGLPFFGMVVGLLIVAAYMIWSSKGYNRKLAANGGVPVPEWRLPPVIIGGTLFAAGLFWFGWTGYTRDIHWIVPTLSGLLTGFGILAIFIQLFNYIIDSYLMFAASAIAGNTFLRSITAAGFPLFARQMFNGMGIQYAGTLLGCFAALLIPIPVCFYLYGRRLREKSRFSPTMADKPPLDEESSLGEELGEGNGDGGGLDAVHSRTTDGTGMVNADVEKKG
ncbi:hypothetical protein GJ744_012058 [Endocarpon pusillum]|uniref:Major facilitator superfamily (MFS) profile domain-containing protein n=1 Tax=Endocarpon pusillum TaxID=364733 RepID=A0A8H7ABT5_9EURO|nr:hypothetical protein GJ744_012058 [Endocarpon pusillum]